MIPLFLSIGSCTLGLRLLLQQLLGSLLNATLGKIVKLETGHNLPFAALGGDWEAKDDLLGDHVRVGIAVRDDDFAKRRIQETAKELLEEKTEAESTTANA